MKPRSMLVRPMAAVASLAVVILAAGCGIQSKHDAATTSTRFPERADKASHYAADLPAAAPPVSTVGEMAGAQEELSADAAGYSGGAGAPSVPHVSSRMLIRNVSMLIVVGSVDSASTRIERLVRQHGGFIESSSAENRGGNPTRTYRLRVPGESVDAMVAELRAMCVRVERESQGVQDVTDQVVDVQARLRTLRATETELLGLLRDARARGQKTQDIMAVYRELTGIRTQIEQYEGQLQSLRELSALSTITVELAPDAAVSPIQAHAWRPGETIQSSLKQLVGALRGFADFAIWAGIVVVPIGGIVAALIIVMGYSIRRVPVLQRVRRQS